MVRCSAVELVPVRCESAGRATASAAVPGGLRDPLADGVVELRRPWALAGEDVRRDLQQLERRRVVRPRRGAGVDVGEPPLPGLAVAEDVDPELAPASAWSRPLAVEPDRGRAERRVVAAGVAGGPAERPRPRTGRAAPEMPGNGSGSGTGGDLEEPAQPATRSAEQRERGTASGANPRTALIAPPLARALRARAPRTARARAGRRANPSRPPPPAARPAGSASPAPRASCRTASAGPPAPRGSRRGRGAATARRAARAPIRRRSVVVERPRRRAARRTAAARRGRRPSSSRCTTRLSATSGQRLDDPVELGRPDAHAAALERRVAAAGDDARAALGDRQPVAVAPDARVRREVRLAQARRRRGRPRTRRASTASAR